MIQQTFGSNHKIILRKPKKVGTLPSRVIDLIKALELFKKCPYYFRMKEILRAMDSNAIKVEPCEKSSASLKFTPTNMELKSTIPTLSFKLSSREKIIKSQNVDKSQTNDEGRKDSLDYRSTDLEPISANETQVKGPSENWSVPTAIPVLSLKSVVEKSGGTKPSPSSPGSGEDTKHVADSNGDASSSDDSSTDDGSSESDKDQSQIKVNPVTPTTHRPLRKIFTAEFKAANSYQAHKRLKSTLSGKIAGFITTPSKSRKRQIVITPMPVPKNLPIGGSRQQVHLYTSKSAAQKVIPTSVAPKSLPVNQVNTASPVTNSSDSPLKKLAERLSTVTSEKTPNTLVTDTTSKKKSRRQDITESQPSASLVNTQHDINLPLEAKKLMLSSQSDLPAAKRTLAMTQSTHCDDNRVAILSDIHPTKRHCGSAKEFHLSSQNTKIDDNPAKNVQKNDLKVVDEISKGGSNSIAKPSLQSLHTKTNTIQSYGSIISNLTTSNPTMSQASIRSMLDLFNETAKAKNLQATMRVENMERISKFEFHGLRELEDLEVALERGFEDFKLRVDRKFEDFKLKKERNFDRFKVATTHEESMFGLELQEQFKKAIRNYQIQEQTLSC